MYNPEHFFVSNEIGRYSVGTKNKDLQLARDGSLTIYVQSDVPTDPQQRANWLPAPKDTTLFVEAGPVALLRLRRVVTAVRGHRDDDVVVGVLGGGGLYAGLLGRYGRLEVGLGAQALVGGVSELHVLLQVGAALFGPS